MALTNEEKGQLAQKIARGVQVMCSSIAQLYLGSPDPGIQPYEDESGVVGQLREHGADKWKFTNIEGALLLTRDAEKILHFKIYDLQQFRLRFQYELYEDMLYQKLTNQLHTFEMEQCVCGFSFSSPQVADKFYSRVISNIPKKTITQPPAFRKANNVNTVSSGFQANAGKSLRPLPRAPAQGSKKNKGRKASKASKGAVFLGNGMLDPNNVPKEWRKILKKAGIKKSHLKDPQMFQIIKETLTAHNIDLEPPTELNFNDPRLREYYTDAQIREWKEYQEQMKAYEEDQKRYQREMETYRRQQEKQEKLQQMISAQPKNGPTGMAGLRQSVEKGGFQNMRHLIPRNVPAAQEMPRMSVARPNVPALPVVPPEVKIAKSRGIRESKVMMKSDLMSIIKTGNVPNLKRVSVLPTIKDKSAGEQNSILETLRARLAQQRVDVAEDPDTDSEWDEDE